MKFSWNDSNAIKFAIFCISFFQIGFIATKALASSGTNTYSGDISIDDIRLDASCNGEVMPKSGRVEKIAYDIIYADI